MLIGLLVAMLAADIYEFPKGVPVRAADVVWYEPTDLYQDFGHGGRNGGGLEIRNRRENSQNWNNEFPWNTGGIDDSDNAKTFKFYRKGAVVYRTSKRGRHFSDDRAVYNDFELPPDAMFGEVIQVDGRTTEVRLLLGNEKGEATFKAFRPFATRSEFPKKWIVSESFRIERLRNNHSAKIIDETRFVCDIMLTEEGVNEILRRPFKDVTDVVFSEAETGEKCFAPTTTQQRGIVPRKYTGGFFDSKNCRACHATAGAEGRLLDRNPSPDKYGNIRGGGFVFSGPLLESLE